MSPNEKEIEDNDLEHLRWLIDQKLEYFKSFESRALQLLGISGLLLTLIWTGYSFETAKKIEISLIILFLGIIIVQCGLFLDIGRPKEAKGKLTPGDRDHMVSNMKAYFDTISDQLTTRAKRTEAIYWLFASQIVLLVILTVIVILRS